MNINEKLAKIILKGKLSKKDIEFLEYLIRDVVKLDKKELREHIDEEREYVCGDIDFTRCKYVLPVGNMFNMYFYPSNFDTLQRYIESLEDFVNEGKEIKEPIGFGVHLEDLEYARKEEGAVISVLEAGKLYEYKHGKWEEM